MGSFQFRSRQSLRFRAGVFLVGLFGSCLFSSCLALADEPIVIDSAVVTLIDRVEIPARTSGLLVHLFVREGGDVERGTSIALVDEATASLSRELARTEVANAERLAANELAIEIAQRELEIAAAELKRATDASEKLAHSVSQSELDELRLKKERAELSVKQARFDQETAQAAVTSKQHQFKIAEAEWQRHYSITPIAGMIAEVYKRQGEWVEAGEAIARVVRTDVMRVEGFVEAVDASQALMGHRVSCVVQVTRERQETVTGTVTLVSTEIHPVTLKVRVVAEIDNQEQKLRPGLRATMTIDP